MPEGLGYSFEPGSDVRLDPRQGGARVPGVSPQQAVKMLSLRIPERPSPRAIAPQMLLQSRGSAGAGASGLNSLVAALMQAFGQSPGMQGAGAPGAGMPGAAGMAGAPAGMAGPGQAFAPPPPRIIPGDRPPAPGQRFPGSPISVAEPPSPPTDPFANDPDLASQFSAGYSALGASGQPLPSMAEMLALRPLF